LPRLNPHLQATRHRAQKPRLSSPPIKKIAFATLVIAYLYSMEQGQKPFR
jgi:hypothetical protein